MKPAVITFSILIFCVPGFTQSKKQKIQALVLRVDSLLSILAEESVANSEEQFQLRMKVNELQTKVNDLKKQVHHFRTNNSQLEGLSLKLSNQVKSSELKMATIKGLIRQKTDSLKMYRDPFRTTVIAHQVWMAENLSVDRFSNGDIIFEAKDAASWKAAGEARKPAWCYYNNDPAMGIRYGKLYNGYAIADSRDLCPIGWHAPSDDDWSTLGLNISKLGLAGFHDLGGSSSNNSGNNQKLTEFQLLKGGFRYADGRFDEIGLNGYWWCAGEIFYDSWIQQNLDSQIIYMNIKGEINGTWDKGKGYSVICNKN